MGKIEDFAFRCENWVIWNLSGWSDTGWINLCMTRTFTHAELIDGKIRFRPTFRMGWNGSRFSQCKEIARMQKIDPDAEQILTSFLARALPCPMVTA